MQMKPTFLCVANIMENKIYTINSKQHNYTQLDNNDKLYIYTCIFELRYDQKKKKPIETENFSAPWQIFK